MALRLYSQTILCVRDKSESQVNLTFLFFFSVFFLCHLPANHIIGIEIRGDNINDLLLLTFPGSSKLTFSMKKSKNFKKVQTSDRSERRCRQERFMGNC